jgi:hypothetical protein
MSKILTEKEKNLQWLKNEIESDEKDLEREKMAFISQIKHLKKEDIISVKEEQLTLWQRIKKVLLGI